MLRVDTLREFLQEHAEREFPSAHRAFQAAVAADAPGKTVSIHESHVTIGGELIALPAWARAFRNVLDRPSLRRPLRGRILLELLESLERCDWQPIATGELEALLEPAE